MGFFWPYKNIQDVFLMSSICFYWPKKLYTFLFVFFWSIKKERKLLSCNPDKSCIPKHTASSWNITIQWTSHDNLTEKLVSLVSSAKLVKWQNVKLHFVIWQKNCLCLTLLDDQIFISFWKSNPWMNLLEKKNLLYQFLH